MIGLITRTEWSRLMRSSSSWLSLAVLSLVLAWFYLLQIDQYLLRLPLLLAKQQSPGVADLLVSPLIFNAGQALMVITPMLSLRAFSAEYREGLMPLFLASPIKSWQWLAGKFFGMLLFVSLPVLLVASMILNLAWFTDLDLGKTLASLLALAVLAAAFTAICLMISAWFQDGATAAIFSFSLLLLFWILDWASRMHGAGKSLLQDISIFQHFSAINSGYFKVYDLLYFVSLISICLILAFVRIHSLRYRGQPGHGWQNEKKHYLGAALLLVISLAGPLLSQQYPMPLDSTHNSRLSPDPASRDLLQQLPGEIKMQIFVRDDLLFRQRIEKALQPYLDLKPDIHILFINPAEEAELAHSLGIRNEGEIRLLYNHRETMIREQLDERSVLKALAHLAGSDKPRWLVFSQGYGERDPLGMNSTDWSNPGFELASQGINFTLQNLSETPALADNANALFILSPQTEPDLQWQTSVSHWLNQGGNLLFCFDVHNSDSANWLLTQLGLETGTRYDHSLYTQTTLKNELEQLSVKLLGAIELYSLDERHEWQSLLYRNETVVAVRKDDTLATGKKQRIIVISDCDFASNLAWTRENNRLFTMTILKWLTDDDIVPSIHTASAPDRNLELEDNHKLFLALFYLIFIPLMAFLNAYRKRNKSVFN